MKTLNNETVCPICGSPLAQKRVDYIDSFGGQYLIVQEVPVRECAENGHQFFHASIAKKIEKLFEMERQHILHPKTTISVPVVELDAAI